MRRVKFELYLDGKRTWEYYEAPTRAIALGMVEQDYNGFGGYSALAGREYKLVKVTD